MGLMFFKRDKRAVIELLRQIADGLEKDEIVVGSFSLEQSNYVIDNYKNRFELEMSFGDKDE